jgi:hypothetical protein
MYRKFAVAAVVTLITFGIALADEFTASITKVEDGKVTFHKTKFNKEDKKLEKGEAMTLPVSKDLKVTKAAFGKGKGKAGDPLEGGLKNELFTKISEKGLFAQIVTDSDNKNITEIRVFAGFGKKDKKDKK